MPHLLSMPYIEYSFTDDEIVVAATYTELQVQYLETQLAQVVREKNNLAYDPTVPNSEARYINENEFLRGQISVFELLLNTNNDLKERQRELMKRQAESQQNDAPN